MTSIRCFARIEPPLLSIYTSFDSKPASLSFLLNEHVEILVTVLPLYFWILRETRESRKPAGSFSPDYLFIEWLHLPLPQIIHLPILSLWSQDICGQCPASCRWLSLNIIIKQVTRFLCISLPTSFYYCSPPYIDIKKPPRSNQ